MDLTDVSTSSSSLNISSALPTYTTVSVITKEEHEKALAAQKFINDDILYKANKLEQDLAARTAEVLNTKRDLVTLSKIETDPSLISTILDNQLVESLIEKNPEYIKHLIYPTVKMLFTVVNKSPELLEVVLDKAKNVLVKEEDIQYKLITAALKNHYSNDKFIPVLEDALLDRLIDFNPFILEHYRFTCKEYQYIKAIQNDANVFQYVPHPTMEQIELAIKLNYHNIKYSPVFTEHLAMSVLRVTCQPALLKSNPHYCETPIIAQWFVDYSPSGISYVENQTLALCKRAKQKYGVVARSVFTHIRNPFKRFYVRWFV